MDNKVLDEAVEAAIRKWYADDPGHKVEAWQVEYMRAAILAALPVLLDRVIGDMEHHYEYDIVPTMTTVHGWARELHALYAPSLGEGDE